MDRVWDPVNTKLFPKTTAILKELQVPVCEAFFAKQAPHTGIKPHTGLKRRAAVALIINCNTMYFSVL